jgi:tetratricopeptide (TPR) repeat protein
MGAGIETQSAALAARFARDPALIGDMLGGVAAGAAELGAIVAAARIAADAAPERADVCCHAADAEWRAGNRGAAQTLVNRALRASPDHPGALVRGAEYLRARGENARALAQLRRAVARGADDAEVHCLLGDLWRERGEWLSARRAYRRALELNAGLTAARAGLAAVTTRS